MLPQFGPLMPSGGSGSDPEKTGGSTTASTAESTTASSSSTRKKMLEKQKAKAKASEANSSAFGALVDGATQAFGLGGAANSETSMSRWTLPPPADIDDEHPKVRAIQLYADPNHPFSRKAMLHINDAVVSHHAMAKYEDALAQHFMLSDKRGKKNMGQSVGL